MELGVIILYFILLGILTIYAFHRYILIFLFRKYEKGGIKPVDEFEQLPMVTIQLPLYNEVNVIERLLRSVAVVEYPKEKLEIQVLDDSTDETQVLAQQLVDELKRDGFNIVYKHRNNRKGFKAGALQEGLATAKGEFIAIFDADFILAKNFLMRGIHYFKDEKVAVVQSRWGHINSDYSLLTNVQAIMLDGHFIIEHIARNRSGRFLNFNGTGGIWRKKAIEDSGGWHSNTLTEDLDLSYRCQMRGWKFIYLPDLVSYGELPIDVDAFKKQQFRWTKGAIQTAKKLLISFLKADLPLKVKIEGFFHLTNSSAYLLMFFLSILMFPSMLYRFNIGWYELMYFDLPVFCLATFSIGAFYTLSVKEIYPDWKLRLKYIPFLMALGYGLCVSNGRAVIEGLLGVQSEFVRTPKYNFEKGKEARLVKRYDNKKIYAAISEFIFAIYYAYAIYFCIDYGLIAAVPFLLLFAFGFWYIWLYTIWQSRESIFGFKIKTAYQDG